MKTDFLKRTVGFVTLIFVTALFGSAAAQSSGEVWVIKVEIFSGRPNPVFILTESELADVRSRVVAATPLAGVSASTVQTILPVRLGYRGLKVTGKSADGKHVTADIELSLGRILRRAPSTLALLDDKSVGLERLLLSLGEAKKAIPPEAMQEIQRVLP